MTHKKHSRMLFLICYNRTVYLDGKFSHQKDNAGLYLNKLKCPTVLPKNRSGTCTGSCSHLIVFLWQRPINVCSGAYLVQFPRSGWVSDIQLISTADHIV